MLSLFCHDRAGTQCNITLNFCIQCQPRLLHKLCNICFPCPFFFHLATDTLSVVFVHLSKLTTPLYSIYSTPSFSFFFLHLNSIFFINIVFFFVFFFQFHFFEIFNSFLLSISFFTVYYYYHHHYFRILNLMNILTETFRNSWSFMPLF